MRGCQFIGYTLTVRSIERMAAVQAAELVTITINEIEIQVPKGELIVESVKRLGVEIPIFCYHPRMEPVGMCRMCLVEVGFKQPDGSVRKMPKPQAGCTLPASEGMVVYTDTQAVHRDRKGVLEFLLANHPLDCPICDRGGECPLQNNTIFYGPATSRFIEAKRHAHKAFPLSNYVTLDLERCIQCGRCVRFTEEISGDSQLAFRFRGAEMQPSTFGLTNFESKFSGNVIEICPVGALTSSHYRFRARPWDLESREAICTGCSQGCNVWFDTRSGAFVRMNGRTNEGINEEWTCDKGKFGQDWYNSSNRPSQPMMRVGDTFESVSWAKAYEVIIEQFRHGGNRVAGLVGGVVSNEGLYLFQKLFREAFESNNLDHRFFANHVAKDHPAFHVATKIADLEAKKTLFAFGAPLEDEQPMIFLRSRKAVRKFGAKMVLATSGATMADEFASVRATYREGGEVDFAMALLLEAVSAGKAKVPAALQKSIEGFSAERAASMAGTTIESVRAVYQALESGAVVITSQSLLNAPNGHHAIEALAEVARATGAEFNCYAVGASDKGAELLGVLPDASSAGGAGLGSMETLSQAAGLGLKALWLVEADPIAQASDQSTAVRALENVDFLVVQTSRPDLEALHFASLILPMQGPAEQDGTYTNAEGTVQRMSQALKPVGDAKQSWRIFGEVLMRAKGGKPYFSAKEVFAEIRTQYPSLDVDAYGEGPTEFRKPVMTGELAEVN